MCRATAWPTRNAPFRLTAITASQSASVMSRKSAALEDAGVVDQTVDAAERGQRGGQRGVDLGLAATRRSAGTARAGRPRRATAPAPGRARRPRPTARPRRRRCARRRAQAAPMPCAAPVITATLPSSPKFTVDMRMLPLNWRSSQTPRPCAFSSMSIASSAAHLVRRASGSRARAALQVQRRAGRRAAVRGAAGACRCRQAEIHHALQRRPAGRRPGARPRPTRP